MKEFIRNSNVNSVKIEKVIIVKSVVGKDTKEDLCREITEIATIFEYHSLEDNVSLGRLEINAINEKRQQVFTIGELIHNLDKLRIRESEEE